MLKVLFVVIREVLFLLLKIILIKLLKVIKVKLLKIKIRIIKDSRDVSFGIDS